MWDELQLKSSNNSADHTLNPHILYSLMRVWKCMIRPQKPNPCAVSRWNREGDIVGSGKGTTLMPAPPRVPGQQTGDGRGLLQCGPLRAAAGFTSESPLCHGVKLCCLRMSAPKWHQARKISGRSWRYRCLLKDICCLGNVRESDSLALKSSVSVNQQINRQDVGLFSLKISTMSNFCPNWDSQTAP